MIVLLDLKPHQITRTDHPRFEGSELRVSNNDDLASAARVLESNIAHQGRVKTPLNQ